MGIIESLEGIGGDLTVKVVGIYENLVGSENQVVLFLIAMLILAFYCYVVLLFYRKLSKRDIFDVNLEDKHGIGKVFEVVMYIVKYLIMFPLYTIFWFLFLSYTLLFLGALNFEHVLFLAALVLSSTRLLAYFNQTAAGEIAKLLPFVFLSAVLLNPSILGQTAFPIDELIRTEFVPQVFFYLGIIFALEITLRIFYEVSLLVKLVPALEKKKKKKGEENNNNEED